MRTIVVGCDGSKWAHRALQRACELAEGGRVIAVNCAEAPGSREKAEQKRVLERAQQQAAEQGVEAELVEVAGDPAEAVVAVAREQDADLVVVGARGVFLTVAGAPELPPLGSVAARIVNETPSDVLVVR